jgi:hypothetical protein
LVLKKINYIFYFFTPVTGFDTTPVIPVPIPFRNPIPPSFFAPLIGSMIIPDIPIIFI